MSRIGQKIELNPIPLQNLSLKELKNELEAVSTLLETVVNENRRGRENSSRNNAVIDKALIEKLILRRNLCEVEINKARNNPVQWLKMLLKRL